jgi:hypothetical protein
MLVVFLSFVVWFCELIYGHSPAPRLFMGVFVTCGLNFVVNRYLEGTPFKAKVSLRIPDTSRVFFGASSHEYVRRYFAQ